MPRRRYKNLLLSQRVAIGMAMVLLIIWSKGSRTLSLRSTGLFLSYRSLAGVFVWESGPNHPNGFAPTTIEDNRFFIRLIGGESIRPITIILVHHWIFGVMILLMIVWFVAMMPRYLRLRRREEEGECVQCGYPLVGNTSGSCSECGIKLPYLPFSFRSDGVAVAEGITDINREGRYQLNISTTIDATHPIEQRIRQVNEAIIRWVRQRGIGGGRVVINYVADSSLENEIVGWTVRLANQRVEEHEILNGLAIDLTFSGSSRKVRKRMTLAGAQI